MRSSHVRLQGRAVYLHCDSHCAVTDTVRWYRGQDTVTIEYTKYFLVKNGGLVIMNLTTLDGATYHCKSATVLLAEHVINITRKSLVFFKFSLMFIPNKHRCVVAAHNQIYTGAFWSMYQTESPFFCHLKKIPIGLL